MKTIILISTLATTFILNASNLDNKELKLKLEPQTSYDENMRYEQKVEEYKEIEEKRRKKDIDIDVNVDVNKEQKSIDKLKLDMGTKF
ncbi:hypothetical protein GCM10012288_00610 [Malaciobacter pacificus]|jgi:maltose-binding protein MalE|uniref:Uncharacterized protein n=1 Tax=Malaciobacter pacificus TaxID=1080223 RepID=A0A5C2H2Z0_9BACT|nr:hypothetical protein [Malaciobacter pacificus]QEP33320.1 hypothetical protein APAC_0150 [Malaciobacter pacificus]GGD30432.1 hypothetical protein GCM10012288_00610 [Malaciobacter pacificus]